MIIIYYNYQFNKIYTILTINVLEEVIGFKFPALYHQLLNDKLLENRIPNTDWCRINEPNFNNLASVFLVCQDTHPLSAQLIKEMIDDIYNPEDYRCLDPKIHLVPFAVNGAGDLYCFYLNQQIGDDIPVVLMWHDDNRLDLLAKNLKDFIFRSLIELVNEENISFLCAAESIKIWETKVDLKTNLNHVLAVCQKYIYANQFQQVIKVFEQVFERQAFLKEGELNEILVENINFEGLNKVFPYEKAI